MSKRLLIITRHRLNENNGGANGSKGFIRCFAELFDDCSIIYPEFDNPAAYIPLKYKLIPCHDSRSKIRKGLDCYRGVLSPLASFSKTHLSDHKYDIIVIDHSFIATGLIKTIKQTGAKIITIHHNVESDYLNDNRQQFSLSFRIPYIYYAKKAERDCLQGSDINLTVTEKDAIKFKTWYKDIHIYNWGNFEYKPIPPKTFTARERNMTFIITGSLCFIQSLQPILEFIHKYWPIATSLYPDAKLIIAGREPSSSLLQACEKIKSIAVIPNPKDISSLVQQASYYVCPINAGSGRKLRVLDGLKQGLPVLCHLISMSGYECMADNHCMFTYHDEQSFEVSLKKILASNASAEFIYQTYRTNFSIKAGVEKLRMILKKEALLP